MLCKFCYDAKRTGYTSHNFKNEHGQTVCPYLLKEVVCGYCKKCDGHTTKYCPILLRKSANGTKSKPSNSPPPASNIPAPQKKYVDPAKQKNGFSALLSIMENEDDAPVVAKQQQAPVAKQQQAPVAKQQQEPVASKANVKSWAGIVVTGALRKAVAVAEPLPPAASSSLPEISAPIEMPKTINPYLSSNWGDQMDEDDEEARRYI